MYVVEVPQGYQYCMLSPHTTTISYYSNKISINNINEKYHHIHMMWKKNLILSLDSPTKKDENVHEALSPNEISDYSYSQLSPRSMNEKVEEELERLGRLLKGGNNIPPLLEMKD